jgi:hypothetical protein
MNEKKVNNFLKNKRGQGLSTNAIILIILGVAVLVLLIIGFTVGWNTLLPWLNQNNVETIVQQCNAACVTGSKYDFCSKERELNDGENKIKTNCATFSVISEYSLYGIEQCSSISCEFECTSIMGKGVVKEEACGENEDDITSISSVTGGQKCCVPKV